MRNWNAVNAHFRQAGPHKSGPRGGASNDFQDYLLEYEAVSYCDPTSDPCESEYCSACRPVEVNGK